jgi:acid phosphatase
MFKKLILLIITFSLTQTTYALEPQNLDLVKQSLMQYHSSGQYQKDTKIVIDQAMTYLKKRISQPYKKPLAIVLDIDETSLSNYPDMAALSFGGSLDDIMREEAKGTDQAIKPTLELYQFAKANHVAVFFVTGRTQNYKDATIKNLKQVGYTDFDDLILKPENYNEKTVSIYKAGARKAIQDKGYNIVLNIGDQQSDLDGGFAEKSYKLPNPYYLIP